MLKNHRSSTIKDEFGSVKGYELRTDEILLKVIKRSWKT